MRKKVRFKGKRVRCPNCKYVFNTPGTDKNMEMTKLAEKFFELLPLIPSAQKKDETKKPEQASHKEYVMGYKDWQSKIGTGNNPQELAPYSTCCHSGGAKRPKNLSCLSDYENSELLAARLDSVKLPENLPFTGARYTVAATDTETRETISHDPELTAKKWNDKYPLGTRVRYYPRYTNNGEFVITEDCYFIETTTRGKAWTTGSGEVLVCIEDYAGGVNVDKLMII